MHYKLDATAAGGSDCHLVDGVNGGCTVFCVTTSPREGSVGLAMAAAQAGVGAALADALHPNLGSWVLGATSDPQWGGVCKALRGGEPGSSHENSGSRAEWVVASPIDVKVSRFVQTLLSTPQPEEDLLQLAANALDGALDGLGAHYTGTLLATHAAHWNPWDILRRRKNVTIDTAAIQLLDGGERGRLDDVCDALLNGECTITPSHVALLPHTDAWWPILLAAGVRVAPVVHSWVDVAGLLRWAPTPRHGQAAISAARSHRVSADGERPRRGTDFLMHSSRRAREMGWDEGQIELARRLNLRLLTFWASEATPVEIQLWVEEAANKKTATDQITALSVPALAHQIGSSVSGIAGKALFDGRDSVTFGAGVVIAPFLTTPQAWQLAFALAETFAGTITQLGETVVALGSAQ